MSADTDSTGRGVLAQWRIGAPSVVNTLAKSIPEASLTFADSYNQSVVQLVVEGGQMDALTTLLNKKPLPRLDGAILTAAAHGRYAMIPPLVRAGVNVRETDAMGSSALHRAAECGNAEIIKLLVEMGCHVDCTDRLQRTPLHLAVQAGAVSAVIALLKAGADITATDDLGRNAGDVNESMRSSKGVDDASLAAIYDIFKDELEALKTGGHSALLAQASDSAPRIGANTPALKGVRSSRDILSATAAATGDAGGPIRGIEDMNTLLALVLAKFRASVEQELVDSYAAIYQVLDSAGDGQCSAGDLASGVLEMGIEISADLLPGLMERMTGRIAATTISLEEFESFCKLTPDQLAALEPPVSQEASLLSSEPSEFVDTT